MKIETTSIHAGQTVDPTIEVKLFTRATSFGGVHSLIEHRASIEPATTTSFTSIRRPGNGR
jgi:hypothetical protein